MNSDESYFEIIAKTFEGLENVLADEITYLGGRDIEILNRAVMYRGDKELVYKSNLWLRSALRIILPFDKYVVNNSDDLYKHTKSIDWQKFITPDKTIAVDSSINSSPFNHENYVALKVKDAIADKMRDVFGTRPSVNAQEPDLLVNVHIFKNECTISLDSSGRSLHKRGYRQAQTDAPLNEVLAAGLLLMTGWKGETDFYDPMCGSGTFTTEAFNIAMNKAPGLGSDFGFMKWNDFNADIWNVLNEKALEVQKPVNVIFHTSDIAGKSVAVTKLNMRSPEMRKKVIIKQADFFETLPQGATGLIIMNPPYGERLDVENPKDFYKKIGDKLKFDYPDFNAWILLPGNEASKMIGLRPAKKANVMNGAFYCKFNKYELYSGSKKSQYSE
ncbi:MAG: class I SAM-dependent RNA methyltransferase [Candidatus Kapabacteria bacterium]|nr:class I SAM-dependent RNA methyltransferase [Candidatus Kapabacteria bacterium]